MSYVICKSMELSELVDIVNRLFPEPHASLLAGMLFGIKRTMPDGLYAQLIDTGTIHVVALSGMNISIIVRLVFDMCGRFFGKYASACATVLAIVSFIFLVGPSATIVRAAIMGSLTVLATVFGRKDVPLLTLVFAGGTMILFNPAIVSDISFQLSFAATLGILLFSGKNGDVSLVSVQNSPAHFLHEMLKDDFKITLSAQLFTVPLIMYYFHRISLISPVANVSVGWLVAPITIAGLVTVFLGWIWFPLGKICSFFVYPLLALFLFLVNIFSLVPFSSVELR